MANENIAEESTPVTPGQIWMWSQGDNWYSMVVTGRSYPGARGREWPAVCIAGSSQWTPLTEVALENCDMHQQERVTIERVREIAGRP